MLKLMKSIFLHLFLCASLATTYSQNDAQRLEPDHVKSIWLEKWENSKLYLLGIAEAMPEKQYGFKPTERQMSFQEQLLHIQQNMLWLGTTYFSEETYEKEPIEILTKEQLLKFLAESFDVVAKNVKATPESALSETVGFFAGSKNRLQMLQLLQDHVTHHRGQLIVYLNMKEITPPRYVGW